MTCCSTFTPPYEAGQPRRTWRCDGEFEHRSTWHGGPADDDPGNRAAWPDNQADTQHPGESTVISLRNVYVYLRLVRDQRDQMTAAWNCYVSVLDSLLALAHQQDAVNAADIQTAIDAIPPWARPLAAEGAVVFACDGQADTPEDRNGRQDPPDPAADR